MPASLSLSGAPVAKQPVSQKPNKKRNLIIFIAIIMPALLVSLYLERESRKWVPDAEKKVARAKNDAALQAILVIEKKAADQPKSVEAQTEFAKSLLTRNQFVMALIPAERAVAIDPQNPATHLLLALIYSTLGYRSQSLAQYRETLRIAPKNLEALQKLGDYLQATGENKSAEQVFLQAQTAEPSAIGPRISLANLYLDQSRNNEALGLLEPMLTDLQKVPVAALYIGGKVCTALGQTQRAQDMLREAVKRQPDFADAYHALGAVMCNQAKFSDGIPLLERAISLAPDNASHRYALGNAWFNNYSSANRLPSARSAYEAALERDPQNDWAHYYYGFTLEQMGENWAALREYDRALEINSRFDSAWYRKGAVFTALGKKSEAKESYAIFDKRSKAAITDVHGKRRDNSILDTAEEHYRRGMQLMQKGNKQEALADFRLALQRDPGFSQAKRAIDALGGK